MRLLASFAVALSLLHLPVSAFAQSSAPGAATAAAPDSAAPSLRVDFLGGVLGGAASSTYVSAFSLTPALVLDLGVQLGSHAAIYARAEGGTLLFLNEGAAYLVGEWSPVPVLSLATGIGYDGMSLLSVGGCNPSVVGGHCIQNSWSGISVPMILGLDLNRHERASGGTSAIRLELEGAGGYDARTETWGAHFMIGVGGTWR